MTIIAQNVRTIEYWTNCAATVKHTSTYCSASEGILVGVLCEDVWLLELPLLFLELLRCFKVSSVELSGLVSYGLLFYGAVLPALAHLLSLDLLQNVPRLNFGQICYGDATSANCNGFAHSASFSVSEPSQ